MSFSSSAGIRILFTVAFLASQGASLAAAPIELAFVPAFAEPAFAVAGSTAAASRGDFVVMTGIGGKRSERSRVALEAAHGADSSEVLLPRPPAPSATRSLTLAIGLLGGSTGAGPSRLGRWRLEALVADESREDRGAGLSGVTIGKRHLALRLRGDLSSRMRASVGVSRTRAPLDIRPLGWSGESLPASEMAESLEAAYDLVQNHLVADERAASLTLAVRRSEFAAPVSDPTTAFPDIDAIFADAAERAPARGFAFGGWQLPGAEPMIQNRVAEEVAAANLKLSLFPWLVDPSEQNGWRASLDQGFARVRPWRAGRPGELENVHAIGSSWTAGPHRLAYRHEDAVDGPERGRTIDELSASTRPLASLAVQIAAAKTARPARDEGAALDSVDLSAVATWMPSDEWTLWSRIASGDGRCGPGCKSTFRALDFLLSHPATIRIDGRRVPVRIQGGGSAQHLASAAPSGASDELHWSLHAGVSLTF